MNGRGLAWIARTSGLHAFAVRTAWRIQGRSDNPGWITHTTGATSRNVTGPDGDLAALTTATGGTRLQLTTLHGDIATDLPLDPTQPAQVYRTDEYGNPQGPAPTRYGWLGAKQRSTDTLTSLTLMGVRLYNPTTGRFLQTDPIPGGNANAYDYAFQDPINKLDLDGRYSYDLSFGLFHSTRSPSSLLRSVYARLGFLFPIRGFTGRVKTGHRYCLRLAGCNPVRVTAVGRDFFSLISLSGHNEGAGKRITFRIKKASRGRLYLHVTARGPNAWWQRGPALGANYRFARFMWGAFAENIRAASRWGLI